MRNLNELSDYASYAPGYAAAPDAIPTSPLIQATNTLDMACELSTRLVQLAEKIVGSVPTSTAGQVGGNMPAPSAAFLALSTKSSRTSERLMEAFNAIDRIEAQLP